MYCEDNLDDDGCLNESTVIEALDGFATNIEIAYRISKGDMKYEG